MKLIDRLSAALAVIAGVMVLLLIAVMIYEVTSRYVFGKPTLWAGDMTYMLGGGLFMLAAAFTLKHDSHVSIDFLMMGVPDRIRSAILGVLLLVVAFPAFAAIGWVAINRTIRAYETGETDPVSAFAPLIWPFYGAITLGFIALSLQVLISVLRAFKGQVNTDG